MPRATCIEIDVVKVAVELPIRIEPANLQWIVRISRIAALERCGHDIGAHQCGIVEITACEIATTNMQVALGIKTQC